MKTCLLLLISLFFGGAPEIHSVIDTSTTVFVRSNARCGHLDRVADQGGSGLCWYYATMNVLGQENGDSLRFSAGYGMFFDQMEKADMFLRMAEKYRRGRVDRGLNLMLFRRPTWDGGNWLDASRLIAKYGFVPYEAMPDTDVTCDDSALKGTVRTMLRSSGMQIRRARSRAERKDIRESTLAKIRTLLCSSLGNPPESFEWRGSRYTPWSFRDAILRSDPREDYALIMNDPARPYYRTYKVVPQRNSWNGPDWTYLNLPMEDIESLGIRSLEGGRRFYITCDTNHDGDATFGLYSLSPEAMPKADAVQSQEIASVHAITVAGVKLSGDGSPATWLCENSFGTSRGVGGYVVMESPWLRRYLFRCAIQKKFLDADQLKRLARRPKTVRATSY